LGEAELPSAEATVGQAFRAPKRTVLCIDDDSIVLRYQRTLLESSGYNVLTTPSAHQGLTMALMLPRLDAVVLDYQMPEMNGHEVAVAIKKRRPETLIVMFSASEIPQETLKLVDAVVLKTDAAGQLLPTVGQLCNRFSFS
jgi:CheY-like chemotaxis protein